MRWKGGAEPAGMPQRTARTRGTGGSRGCRIAEGTEGRGAGEGRGHRQDLGGGVGGAGAESGGLAAGAGRLWLHHAPILISQGSDRRGWWGGRGGRTSLNRPGNSRGVGSANWGAAPHPLPSPLGHFSVNPHPRAAPPSLLSRSPPPSPLPVGSSQESVTRREAASSGP